MLKEEIKSLQKKLENPSPEAVEWRVAYEQLQEELESAKHENFNDDEELRSKNEELDATIEKLCNEKAELEDKLNDIIQSSNETRDEIESMINEVDRLEKEMNSLQNELDDEKARSEMNRRQADEAHSQLESIGDELRCVTNEKVNLEFEWNVMKTKLASLESKIAELNKSLQQKQSELIEMETLSRENELELQCSIEELEKDLMKTKNEVNLQMESAQQTKAQFHDTKTLSESINKDLKTALNQVEEQQKTIKSLEEKVIDLTNQNTSTGTIVKKYQESEETLNERIMAMNQELGQLRKERENLDQRLTCVREQSELTASSLDEKTETVHLLQDQIVKLKDEHAKVLKLNKEETLALERKLSEFKATNEEVKALQSDLESKQQQINELNDSLEKVSVLLACKERVQEELDRRFQQSNEVNDALTSKLKHVEECLAEKDAHLIHLNEENNQMKNETIQYYEEVKLKMEENIEQLKTERSQHLIFIQELQKNLGQTKLEVNMLREELAINGNQLATLKNHNGLLLDKKSQEINTMESKLKDAEFQLNKAIVSQKEIEDILEKERDRLRKKEAEVAKLQGERDAALCSLKDYENSLATTQQSHELRIRQLMEEKKEMQKVIDSNKESFNMSCDVKEELEYKIKELQTKIDALNESHDKAIKEIKADFFAKESSTMKNSSDFEKIIHAKDIELSEMEKSSITLRSEYSQLKKQHSVMKAAEEDTLRKLQTQRDRVILLQREKGQLECECDILREDHNKLNEKLRSMSKDKNVLQMENESLKRTIENMKADIHFSDSRSRGGSTFENDSRLSYDDVSTEMDSVLGKMSSEPIHEEEECVDPMEESFDESMFLPTVTYDEKENEPVDTNILATPSKLDYGGGKRQPLSERKQNRTPLRSVNKLKSSTKKLRSSTKKARSQYMMFNNKVLFGEK